MSKPDKKIILLSNYFPPQKGGMASYYEGFASAYKNIAVLTSGEKRGEFPFLVYRKKLITNLPIWPKWLPAVWQTFRAAKKEKADILLAGEILPMGTVCFILNKFFKFPYGIVLHGFDIKLAAKNKRKKKLAQLILKNAKFIIANSNFTKNEILRLGRFNKKIIVIYPCPKIIPPASKSVAEKIKQEYNLSNKKIILSVGRIVKRKGFDKLIKSLPQVFEVIDEAICVIVGEGEILPKLKKEAQILQIKNRVIFIGCASDSKLAAWYSLCDLFIMPARRINEDVEGFGIVYLEANSFAKPVISGRDGGEKEAVLDGKTGLLVNSHNLESIAEAIIKILKNPELGNKIGETGRKRVDEEFKWKKQVEKLKDFL